MSEGAKFQIVLVDETPPDTATPSRPDTGPGPAPQVQPPPVQAPTPTDQPSKTDRPAPLADSATPVKERADRKPTQERTDLDRVTRAAVVADDTLGTGGLVRKAVAVVDAAKLVIDGINAASRLLGAKGDPAAKPEAPKQEGLQADPKAFDANLTAAIEELNENTKPEHLEKQAETIVSGLRGTGPITLAEYPAPEKPSLPAPSIEEPEAPPGSMPTTPGPPPIQAPVAKEAATGAEAATAAKAARAATAATEGVAAASTSAGASLTAVAVAAAPVAIALGAVALAAYKAYEEFQEIWNTARKQQDQMVQYSDSLAIQQAETQVRREARMIERADELGERLARIGEVQDRNDEAWEKLSDAIDDILIRNLETILPLIEAVTAGVTTIAEGIDVANATGQLITATLQDWLNLAGTEAEQDAAYYKAEANLAKKWEAYLTEEKRAKEDERFQNDPMLNALNNAWGQNQALDPKLLEDFIKQVRAL